MSRWTVYKAGRYAWTAHREGDLPSELFPTWRMAMDYADRMARTREVVLPRYSMTPRNNSGAFWGARKLGNGYVVFRYRNFRETQVIHVNFADLRPLALALLALAEQETPNEY